VTNQENTKQIENLHQELTNLQQKIDKVNIEIKKVIEKRDALHEQAKTESQQINLLNKKEMKLTSK
jgi:uncharacterized coiled-coil DUF342 family protein